MQDPYGLQRLADRMEIQDLMYRWCRAIDRLDFLAMRELFHSDAIDRHGMYEGDIDGLIEWIRERHKPITFSMHQVSNMFIEFATPDLALAETYIWSVQRYAADAGASLTSISGGQPVREGFGADVMGGSRYVDRFERRDGRWRIALRTVVMGWRTLQEVPQTTPKMMPHWVVGRRDQDDFIFQERVALGIAQPAS